MLVQERRLWIWDVLGSDGVTTPDCWVGFGGTGQELVPWAVPNPTFVLPGRFNLGANLDW